MNALNVDVRGATPVDSIRETYERILASAGPDRAVELHLGTLSLSRAVRRAAAQSRDPKAPAVAARQWLTVRFGEAGGPLQRAAVAALALVLRPDAALLPRDILALYPAMHGRLARFLAGPHPYDDDLFAKDLALAAGATVPVGPLSLGVPPPGLADLIGRGRRAMGGFTRHWRQHGPRAAIGWIAAARARPWAGLHVDVRNLQEFHRDGFLRAYHRLAALMRTRPDLAGVYGVSWLYDPKVAQISPQLAFIGETTLAGGGRLIRMRTDPAQTAYALARSPTRRRLWESGAYVPACYGMYWERAALIAWAEGEPAEARPVADKKRDTFATVVLAPGAR